MSFKKVNPQRSVLIGFLSAIVIGTSLLFLPAAHQEAANNNVMDDLFTAVSATCVTGLTTVDTATYWTFFGQVIILALIQMGGLGFMTLSTAIGAFVLRKISLNNRLKASAEVRGQGLFDLRRMVIAVIRIALLIEFIGFLFLFSRFFFGYKLSFTESLWRGIFHSVSSFNNAGFALYSDNLMGFYNDPWILLPLSFLTILGGLGFPVFMQLRKAGAHIRLWNMGTKLVLLGTPILLFLGTLVIAVLEWNNPGSLGAMNSAEKILNSFAQSAFTRTSGFNNLDISAFHPSTLLFMDVLMFIGGGPAGTAGGIKITTFGVLLFVAITEIRGEGAVNILGKRLARSVHREAITVVLLSTALIFAAVFALQLLTAFTTDQILFEVVSGFATVGLTTGITFEMPLAGKIILIILMICGRIGPVTAAAALVYRRRPALYELPKERPLIG